MFEKLNLLIFLTKFSHRCGIPYRGWNVNILSLDQSKSQDRQQTDGSIFPTVKIEVGNFASMNPIDNVIWPVKGLSMEEGFLLQGEKIIRMMRDPLQIKIQALEASPSQPSPLNKQLTAEKS